MRNKVKKRIDKEIQKNPEDKILPKIKKFYDNFMNVNKNKAGVDGAIRKEFGEDYWRMVVG